MSPYCYHIYHLPTGRHYYGARYSKKCDPSDLWVSYFTSSKIVRELIASHGKNSFVFEIRKIFDTKEQACNWEQKFLTKINASARNDWINQQNGGKNFSNSHTTKGRIKSLEERQKISIANKGKTLSEEHKAKISNTTKGKKKTEEHKNRIAAAHLGKKQSEEHRNKSAIAFKGCKHTVESKQKMSVAGKERVFSETHKQKLSDANRRRKHSEETKRKIGEKTKMRFQSNN